MKKFSLILAVVALFASSANAQTPASKAAPAPVAVSPETVAPAVYNAKAEKKAKKAKKAQAPADNSSETAVPADKSNQVAKKADNAKNAKIVAAPIAVESKVATPAPASAPVKK